MPHSNAGSRGEKCTVDLTGENLELELEAQKIEQIC